MPSVLRNFCSFNSITELIIWGFWGFGVLGFLGAGAESRIGTAP